MHTFNIIWNYKLNPKPFTQSCHIKADDLMGVTLAFNKLHPDGEVLGLKRND